MTLNLKQFSSNNTINLDNSLEFDYSFFELDVNY